MPSSRMLRRVAVVTDVSEELSASFIRVTRIGDLGTTRSLTTEARCEEIKEPDQSSPQHPILSLKHPS
jgi:hypothetical protein